MLISSRAPAVRSCKHIFSVGAHRRGATADPTAWLWTSFDTIP